MADIAVGGNRSTLTTIKGQYDTFANGLDGSRRPNSSGKQAGGRYTGNGTGAATTFTVTHGLNFTPTRVRLAPRNAASNINAFVDPASITSSVFVITTASAIASGTGNVQYDWVATK
jgi:hypothetical protein